MKVACTAIGSETGPHLERLHAAGFQVSSPDRSRNYRDANQLVDELRECVAVIAGVEPYTRGVLEKLPKLRVISRIGVGYDAVDLSACDELGIAVCITPGVNHEAVAEHAIAMLMAVGRGFPDRDLAIRKRQWARFNTPRIAGSTLGILGFGRSGKAVAQRAVGLGLRVLAHDLKPDPEFATRHSIALVSADEIYTQADYISLHLAVTPDTKQIINKNTLRKMKPGAVLINTARGALVDEDALCDALESGQLRGAGLDVFETEPLPVESRLLSQKRVLLSGHVAGLDEQSQVDALTMAATTIVDLNQGHWPAERIVNLQQSTGWTW